MGQPPRAARRPTRPARSAGPSASPTPAPRTTRDSDHQTAPRSPTRYATIASTRCLLRSGTLELRNPHRPSSEGTSIYATPITKKFIGGSGLRRLHRSAHVSPHLVIGSDEYEA